MIKFLKNIPEVMAVMSEREDGSMKLFKESGLNWENRARFFAKIGVGENNVVSAEIVHGTKVEIVDSTSAEIVSGADGIVTNDKNIFLAVTVADCIPVYFYDSERKVIGLAHAGWRGIVNGVIGNTVEKISELGGAPDDLKIAFGPGINVCHFEIKADVLDKFSDYPKFVVKRDGKIFVNLKGIIKKQLTALQIKSENIEDSSECTFENNRYFSFRRDRPETIEAMVAVIGLASID